MKYLEGWNTNRFKLAIYSISSMPRYIEDLGMRSKNSIIHNKLFDSTMSFLEYDNNVNLSTNLPAIQEYIKNISKVPHKRILSVTKELKEIAKENNWHFISYNNMINIKCSDLGDYVLIGISSTNNIPILFNMVVLYEYINGMNIVKSVVVFKKFKGIIENIDAPYTYIKYSKPKSDNQDYVISSIIENAYGNLKNNIKLPHDNNIDIQTTCKSCNKDYGVSVSLEDILFASKNSYK